MNKDKSIQNILVSLTCLFIAFMACIGSAYGLSANKVWFEIHPGFYRVLFEYTLPEIKEFRGGYVDFTSKKKAEVYYWSLIRGADFQLGSPKNIKFMDKPPKPKPW